MESHITSRLRRVLAMCLLALTSCTDPKPDFGFLVESGSGISPGQPVEWREVPVGTVAQLRPDRGRIRVDVLLLPEFRGAMPSDLRARVVHGFLDEKPRILLFNQGEPGHPLAKGSLIPTETSTPADRARHTIRELKRAGREVGAVIERAVEECLPQSASSRSTQAPSPEP